MDGERSPSDLATSASARTSAIDQAFASMGDDFFADGPSFSAEARDPGDAQPEPDAATDEFVESNDQSRPPNDQTDNRGLSPSDAPPIWPQDRRDWFATLSDADKTRVLDMEKSFNVRFDKTAKEGATHRKSSEAIAELMKPYEQELRSNGMDHAGGIRTLIQDRERFNQDPAGSFVNFVSQHPQGKEIVGSLLAKLGIQSPQNASGEPQPAEDNSWMESDPIYQQMKQQNVALQQQIQSIQSSYGQFQQSFNQREAQSMSEAIQRFSSAADDQGSPLHPHYDALIPTMKQIMMADSEVASIPDWNAEQKLKAAYEKAVYLNPQVRQQVIDAQINQRLAQQQEQASVKRAQQAAPRKPSIGANGNATQGQLTKDEAIWKAMRDTGFA